MPISFASGKEAFLSDDRNSSVEAFGRVVIDIQPGILQELFELLFDIQGIRDGLGDKGGRLFRLVEYPSLLKKFPDELLRLPTCIFPLLKECGLCALLFHPLFCSMLTQKGSIEAQLSYIRFQRLVASVCGHVPSNKRPRSPVFHRPRKSL